MGPGLLAHVLFAKSGLHLPLNRQSTIYAREGIDLDTSTLADWVVAAAATLCPWSRASRDHVLAAERIHADDTTVPVLIVGKRAPDGYGPPRRPALRRRRSAGRRLLLLARPNARASRGVSGLLCRADAGRCLCRLQSTL